MLYYYNNQFMRALNAIEYFIKIKKYMLYNFKNINITENITHTDKELFKVLLYVDRL